MGIRVAVCDDSPNELEELARNVRNYFAKFYPDQQVELEIFSHPDFLLQEIIDKKFDLFLLDILMPMLNGVELAGEIRRYNPEALIIFVSTTTEFVTDAFSLNAVHYLVKPYSFDKFKESMDRAMKRIEKENNEIIALQISTNNYINIAASRIYYFESSGKFAMMHLSDEDILLHLSVREVGDILTEYPSFYKLGSSYIVNMDSIKQVKDKCIIMKNDAVVSIPRRIYVDFKSAYCKYFSLQ